jgi:hypothetical protein
MLSSAERRTVSIVDCRNFFSLLLELIFINAATAAVPLMIATHGGKP